MPAMISALVILTAAIDIFLYGMNDKNLKKIFAAPIPPPVNQNTGNRQPAPGIPHPPLAISEPIANALSRVTKKPFGIYVMPGFSPVSPERFTGYHTGVDFETTPTEQKVDIPVYAICPGKILVKEWASGYGGVVNISCTLSGQAVTVTYGHLRLASILKKVGETLAQGEEIGMLGTGFSKETDGERRHLHLGIHKGKNAVINGYVATASELAPWINVLDYLKPSSSK